MTPTQPQQGQDRLSQRALEELLRLLVTGQSKRVSSVVLDGCTVWVKRMAAEGRPMPKRLHALVSPLIPWPILRSSRLAQPEEMVIREVRKTRAFAEAGFPAVKVLFQQGSNLALSSASAIAQDRLEQLRDSDPDAHDALLISCASALGKAHCAGLCHGRPHPRDMIVDGEQIGFIDFEEAPEEAMQLVDAQARDLLLMFLQVCGQSLMENTNRRALEAYCAEAPVTVLPRLATMHKFFAALQYILHKLEPIGLGADGKRLLKASAFLSSVFAQVRVQMSDQTLPQSLAGQKPKAMQ